MRNKYLGASHEHLKVYIEDKKREVVYSENDEVGCVFAMNEERGDVNPLPNANFDGLFRIDSNLSD